MRSASVQHRHGMELRADASIPAALLLIGLSATLPVATLYWLMRPTVLPNPGISAYRPPKPDPLLPLPSRAARDPYASSLAAAKRENELQHTQPGAAFAFAQKTEPAPRGLSLATVRQHKRQRGADTYARQQRRLVPPHPPITPFNSWARDHSFATWYR